MRVMLILWAIWLGGCATPANKLNYLSVGMTKQQVLSVLGHPKSTSAHPGTEYLRYEFASHEWRPFVGGGAIDNYFVRLINGQVESFGRMGDFDSTKDPTVNVNTTSQELPPPRLPAPVPRSNK